MCLYELLLLQGGCAVLPQPHPEEAVVYDIAAIVLVDEFPIDQGLESKTHAAGSRQVVAAFYVTITTSFLNIF